MNLYIENTKKMNALFLFHLKGINAVKSAFSKYLSFVEENKNKDIDKVREELFKELPEEEKQVEKEKVAPVKVKVPTAKGYNW